ncbi:UDP-glucose 4-epimerase [Phyllobacterium sp. 1468]|uniref:NAD-dependent epimerase/dehydratase family protein n=1 Tax=Phyllobacterium sp. 1468 TaxID=2817759 RepID=UPI002857BA99|nr:NAD-dependent epimerase/dehydratase family protein [Phyllobacterium sp. 1468]MDR6635544.1 UDP-glucose 4-epimerase [Phyllobacterium sp. 1468]
MQRQNGETVQSKSCPMLGCPTDEEFGSIESRKSQNVVLVTGASGFIGTELVKQLEAAGNRVICTSREPPGGGTPYVRLPSPDEPLSAFESILENVHHVVHLAAIHHAKRAVSAEEYYAANCLLTGKLAAAAHKKITGKFVFTSSIRAQCGSVFDGVLREGDPPQPTDDYGRTKLAAEAEIAAAMPRQNYTILRPVLVYGPNATGNLAKLMKLAAWPIPLPLKSLPGKRSLLDLGALCVAIFHSLEESKTDGEVFIVSDNVPLTIGEMVAAMRRGMGHPPRLFSVPEAFLNTAAKMSGQTDRKQRLYQNLVASSAKLQSTGWKAIDDTTRRIEDLSTTITSAHMTAFLLQNTR